MRRYSATIIVTVVLLVASILSAPVFAQEQVITVFTDIGGAGTAQTGAIELFNQKYAGQYRVEPVRVPWEGMREQLYTELIAQTGAWDVVSVDATWRDAVIPYVEDLTPYLEKYGPSLDEFTVSAQNHIQSGDKIWGLPFRQGVNNLFYVRKDLLEEFGLAAPTTPEEILETARKLTLDTDGDGRIDIYGLGIMAGGPPATDQEFLFWLYSRGGRILDENGNVHPFESKHGELAVGILEEWKQMRDEGIFPPGILTWGLWEPLSYMQEGRLAMATMFSPRALLVNDPEQSTVAGMVEFHSFPHVSPEDGGVHTTATWSVAIPNYISEARKEAAYTYISFLASYEAQKEMALNWANEPIRPDVFSLPEYVELNAAAPAVVEASKHGMVAAESAHLLGPDIGLIISDNVRAVLEGDIDPYEAGKRIFEEIRDLLE